MESGQFDTLVFPLPVKEPPVLIGDGMDAVERRRMSCPYLESSPESSVIQSVA
jgi:hypothetical protein